MIYNQQTARLFNKQAPAEEVVSSRGSGPHQRHGTLVFRLIVNIHSSSLRLLRHVQVEDEVAVGS